VAAPFRELSAVGPVTYNFDPDTWYANERLHLETQLRAGKLTEAELEANLAKLDRRYEEMLDRLDGTYDVGGSTPDGA